MTITFRRVAPGRYIHDATGVELVGEKIHGSSAREWHVSHGEWSLGVADLPEARRRGTDRVEMALDA